MRSEGEEKRRMKTKVEEIEENNVVDEWKDDDGGLEEEFKGDFKACIKFYVIYVFQELLCRFLMTS